MIFQKFAIFSVVASLAAGQVNIGPEDIPKECTAVCADVVSIAKRCDDQNDNEAAELQCICRTPNAGALIPACEACVANFDQDDTDADDVSADENDILSVLAQCSFTTTDYNTESASSILISVASSFASASGSVVRTTSGTVVLTTSIPASTRVPVQSTGAAPVQTGAVGAAMGIGAFGFAMGLL